MNLGELLVRSFDGRRLNPYFRWASWVFWVALVVGHWIWRELPWESYSDRMVIPLGGLMVCTLFYNLTMDFKLKRLEIPMALGAAYFCFALGERLTAIEEVDALRRTAFLTGALIIAVCLLHDHRGLRPRPTEAPPR